MTYLFVNNLISFEFVFSGHVGFIAAKIIKSLWLMEGHLNMGPVEQPYEYFVQML